MSAAAGGRRGIAATALLTALAVGVPVPALADEPAEMFLVAVDGPVDARMADGLRAAGAEVVASFEDIGAVAVDATAADVARLAALDGVAAVRPETVFSIADVQDGAAWNLDRLDAAPGDGAFAYPRSAGTGVRVYVVDTGVAPGHAELGSRLVAGYAAAGGTTADCEGHGTHVAGTIASTTHGVAKRATVVPVRVLDCAGNGSTTTVLSGLQWILDTHPAGTPGVVNLSLGGSADSFVDAAVEELHAAGLVVVAAAGNEGIDACTVSPARVPAALTVGATGRSDERPSFSNYGRCLDLFAPGVGIRSLAIDPGTLADASGTSMAAPHASGVAALVLAESPAATPADVAARILAASPAVVVGAGSGSPTLRAAVPPLVARTAQRLAGASRYETAVAIADAAFPTSTEVVLVAGAQGSIVDGLVAAPFARYRKAPVLLSGGTALGSATRAEISERRPTTVWLVGGSGVLTPSVVTELRSLGVADVRRLAGADRYATAAAVARRMPSGRAAVVASGWQRNLIDAAAASGPAAAAGRPILLTAPGGLPQVVQDVIRERGVTSARVVGGTGAVSDTVVRQLKGLGLPVARLAGADRFATAAAIATAFRSSTGEDTVVVAGGNDANLIDAMAGGVLGRATLLSRGSTPPAVALDWIARHRVRTVVAVGGTGAVPTSALHALRDT